MFKLREHLFTLNYNISAEELYILHSECEKDWRAAKKHNLLGLGWTFCLLFALISFLLRLFWTETIPVFQYSFSNVLLANIKYSAYYCGVQQICHNLVRINKLNPGSPEDEFMRSLFNSLLMCSPYVHVRSSSSLHCTFLILFHYSSDRWYKYVSSAPSSS